MRGRLVFPSLCLLGLAPLWGCGEPDRRPELRSQLAELKKTRMEAELVAKARAEADEAVASLQEAHARSSDGERAARRAAEAAEKRAAGLRSELEKAAARNADLRAELETLSTQQTELAARIEKLGAEKRQTQRRARWVRDQALTFVASYEHDDPSDVAQRRDRSLAEFLARARESLPGQVPALPDVGAAQPEHMREQLQRLADRVSERYALEAVTPQPVASTSESGQRTE